MLCECIYHWFRFWSVWLNRKISLKGNLESNKTLFDWHIHKTTTKKIKLNENKPITKKTRRYGGEWSLVQVLRRESRVPFSSVARGAQSPEFKGQSIKIEHQARAFTEEKYELQPTLPAVFLWEMFNIMGINTKRMCELSFVLGLFLLNNMWASNDSFIQPL